MEPKGTSVSGGIGILHTVKDGNHHYAVDTVIEDKRGKAGFVMRKGDQLSVINGIQTQDLSPEVFAKLLSKGSPMLTVHHPGVNHREEDQKKKKGFYPVSKENTVLTIFPHMVTNPDLQLPGDRGEDLQVNDDWSQDQLESVVLVRMVGTTVAVLRGRGCAHGEICKDCGGADCILEDVVLVSDSTRVTQGPDFERSSEIKDKAIKDFKYKTFLSFRDGNKPYLQETIENITIYMYSSNNHEDTTDPNYKGVPVVLNFTDTNKFLKCSGTKTGVMLGVEECEAEVLRFIPFDKKDLLSFVFYMKAETSTERCFESANFEGWFLHAASSELVDAVCQRQTVKIKDEGKLPKAHDESLYFLIYNC